MTEQAILDAVQEIFRDNFDDDTLVITRDTCADDIEDWDSLEQINLLTAIGKAVRRQVQAGRMCAGLQGCGRPAGSGHQPAMADARSFIPHSTS